MRKTRHLRASTIIEIAILFLVIAIIIYNVYTGLTIQKLGILGFEIEFGQPSTTTPQCEAFMSLERGYRVLANTYEFENDEITAVQIPMQVVAKNCPLLYKSAVVDFNSSYVVINKAKYKSILRATDILNITQEPSWVIRNYTITLDEGNINNNAIWIGIGHKKFKDKIGMSYTEFSGEITIDLSFVLKGKIKKDFWETLHITEHQVKFAVKPVKVGESGITHGFWPEVKIPLKPDEQLAS